MKIKLIKRDDDFYSLKVDGIVMATSNGMLVDYRLSLKNCDEIFWGLYDTEIDVVIVMRPASLVYKSNLVIEELDSEGCLILKKI